MLVLRLRDGMGGYVIKRLLNSNNFAISASLAEVCALPSVILVTFVKNTRAVQPNYDVAEAESGKTSERNRRRDRPITGRRRRLGSTPGWSRVSADHHAAFTGCTTENQRQRTTVRTAAGAAGTPPR